MDSAPGLELGTERWRPAPYLPPYWVSNEGRVINLRTGTVLATRINRTGIRTVALYQRSTGRTVSRSVVALRNEVFPRS